VTPSWPDGRTRRKTERPLAAYLWRPAAVATVWELVKGGGLRMPALGGYTTIEHGDQPDVPGRPTVIGLPGHTRVSVGRVPRSWRLLQR
jgi:glyoxylase-like metal-dependent hydrolase (beta-lactamase superfamily II)